MHRVTLTFDNGPSPETTPFVLEALAERDLRAWFCVVGRMVAADGGAELVQRSLAEGHRVVNHSFTHRTPLGEDPTEAHAEAEIRMAGNLLDAEVDGWDAEGRWFRPFGRGGRLGPHVFSRPSLDVLRADRYSVLLWNSVPGDWIDIDGWPEAARSQIAGHEGSGHGHTVVVLHDLPTGAMVRLPAFLDGLLADGFELTLDPPDVCVPIRQGVARHDLAGLTG